MGSGAAFAGARSWMVQAYAASPLVSALRLLQEPYAAAAWLLRHFLDMGSSSWPRTPPAVWVGRSAFAASNVAAVDRQLEQNWLWIWIWIWIWISVVSQLMQLLPRQLLQLLPRQVLQLLPRQVLHPFQRWLMQPLSCASPFAASPRSSAGADAGLAH